MRINDLMISERVYLASELILGGRSTESFWGISLEEFALKLHQGLRQYIGDPELIELRLQPVATRASTEYMMGALDGVVRAGDQMSAGEIRQAANAVRLVGLSGAIGCGKDTLADHLVERHGFTKMSFADPLRAAASILYGIPLSHFQDRDLKEAPLPGFVGPDGRPMSPRRVLLFLGTEIGRGISENLWIDRMLMRCAARSKLGSGQAAVVISDVRFENEASFVRSLGGATLAFIERPTNEHLAKSTGTGHASENGIARKPGDTVLANDSTLARYLETAERTLGLVAPADRRRPRV